MIKIGADRELMTGSLYRFCRCAPGEPPSQQPKYAAGDLALDIGADFRRGNQIVAALQDQRARRQRAKSARLSDVKMGARTPGRVGSVLGMWREPWGGNGLAGDDQKLP